MTGLRNPSLYELYGTDNFGFSGNRNLEPEKSLTNEINLTFQPNNNFKLSTNLFRSNINNNIEYSSGKYINDTDDTDLNQSGIESVIQYETLNTQYSFSQHSCPQKRKMDQINYVGPKKAMV